MGFENKTKEQLISEIKQLGGAGSSFLYTKSMWTISNTSSYALVIAYYR